MVVAAPVSVGLTIIEDPVEADMICASVEAVFFIAGEFAGIG